jgi:hypothetical protein
METHLAKLLKVYLKLLWCWKESDQRRSSKHFTEETECVEIKIPKTKLKNSDEK